MLSTGSTPPSADWRPRPRDVRARAGADHGRMTSELRDLRGKNAALQAEARNVAARLDSVIERLKVVAEG